MTEYYLEKLHLIISDFLEEECIDIFVHIHEYIPILILKNKYLIKNMM